MSLADPMTPTAAVPTAAPADAELDERFAPILARIAEGAVAREQQRRLPYEEVRLLREAGFTRLRVPVAYGGLGASLPQLFRLLIELGRADSNLPQLLRGHFAVVEGRLGHPDPVARDRWLRLLGEGAIVGNASSEQDNASFRSVATALTPDGDGYRLCGEKYYSTGTLFADWISTTARLESDGLAKVLLPADAPGVTRVDDWDGFGQRLTGSGTTRYDDVRIRAEWVEPLPADGPAPSTTAAFFQLVHLATLAGIGRAALADTVAFVRQRSRSLWNPSSPRPAEDPLVQEVVGGIAGASYAADAITMAAVESVAQVRRLELDGVATPADYDRADAAVFGAQGRVVELVLGVTSRMFEVGGSSAVREPLRLDRHWRNARTVASHNPVVYRDRGVGELLLTGAGPRTAARTGGER
jgi:alkylation response protein AidB-like acyl-CoA dehydrogenase